MSRTHKDRLKIIQANYWKRRDWYADLSMLDKLKVDNWYKQTPSWWTLLFHTSKRRRQERDLLKKILSGNFKFDEDVFPLDKKPHVYYH